jgi:protein-L-isoaspartate O-methyltransferase
MLRLLDVQAGHRVLEVGTGSGYSTALLAHLVGPCGRVSSVDIDPDLVARAGRLLGMDGHSNVTVVHADGRLGHRPGAPYDRVVAWAQARSGNRRAWNDVWYAGWGAEPVRGPRTGGFRTSRGRTGPSRRSVGG